MLEVYFTVFDIKRFLCLAVKHECIINVDSEFDFDQIKTACKSAKKRAKVLIR
jgi:diaminopimelate decarboxylase